MSLSESGRACLERAARILAEGEALAAEAAAATCHIRRYMRHMASDAFTGQQFKKVCSDSIIALRRWSAEQVRPTALQRVLKRSDRNLPADFHDAVTRKSKEIADVHGVSLHCGEEGLLSSDARCNTPCDVILRRFEAMTGASAILARTGQTFEDVAAACTQPETSHDPNEGSSAATRSGEYVQ
jgi:hypothetical protein